MKCNQMPEKLVTFLYGEMDGQEAKAIQDHLDGCEACRESYEELKSTSQLLGQWEEPAPDLNLIFMKEPKSRWAAWKEQLSSLSWGRRLALGVPAIAAACLVVLAVLNTQIKNQQGDWHIQFSLVPQQPASDQTLFTDALEQNQKETLLLISKLIEESEYRQRTESALLLTRYAQEQERQRQQDFMRVNQNFQGLQQTTDGRFNQTSNVLDDLIRLTSYRLEKK